MPTPWGAIATSGLGLIQSIGGAIQAKKAQKQLENLQSPAYAPNQGILDYYSKALQKYQTSPYDTLQYKTAVNNAQRGTATGLDSLRGRGGAVAGVSSLIANQDNNLLNAGVQAEKQKAQEFNILGKAAGMKAGEEKTAFNINQMQPFERQYNLLAAKASGGNKIEGAGISNIFQGLNAYDDLRMANSIYDTGDTGTKSGGGRNKYGNTMQGTNIYDNYYTNRRYNNLA